MKRKKMAAILLMGMLILAAPAFGQSGTILELSGTVELQHPGAAGFTAAQLGDVITADTLVSTGFRSTALIEVCNSRITVRPLTVLTLREIQVDQEIETINVMLQTGRVRVDVAPPAGTRARMDVHSPETVASVRGTSFEFDTRILTVHEGVVAFAGTRGGTMLVGAGSTSQLTEGGRAADPVLLHLSTLAPSRPTGGDSGINHHPPIVDVLQVMIEIYP